MAESLMDSNATIRRKRKMPNNFLRVLSDHREDVELQCRYYSKYQGKRKPRCTCLACQVLWNTKRIDRLIEAGVK